MFLLEYIEIVVGAILIFLAGFYYLKENKKPMIQEKDKNSQHLTKKFIFHKKNELMSSNFLAFAYKLIEAAQPNYKVFFWVRISEFIHIEPENYHHPMGGDYQKLSTNEIDFLICGNNFAIVAIVLFDEGEKTLAPYIYSLCEESNIPIITFRAFTHYTIEDIKRKLYGEDVREIS